MTFADKFHKIPENEVDAEKAGMGRREEVNESLSTGQRKMLSLFRKELREDFYKVVQEVRRDMEGKK